MTNTDQIKILQENKLALKESVRWLQRSYAICYEKFDIKELSDEGYDAFESLTSRFARTADILTNKVFRSIIYLEEGVSYSWLDTLLYLKKNGGGRTNILPIPFYFLPVTYYILPKMYYLSIIKLLKV